VINEIEILFDKFPHIYYNIRVALLDLKALLMCGMYVRDTSNRILTAAAVV